MKSFFIIASVLALVGCAIQPTEIVRGNSQTVMVRSSSESEALEHADRYCGRFGRNAKYKSEIAPCERCQVREIAYDCVD